MNIIEQIHSVQRKNNIQIIGDVCFYSAVIIEIILVLIDKSEFINPIEGRLFQATFILFVIKVLLTKYDAFQYGFILLMALLGLGIDCFSDKNEILRFVIFVSACKGVDIKKCLKYLLWIQVLGCLVISFLSVLGIYGKVLVEKEYQGEGFISRYCFGMGNANSFHTMLFATMLLFLYLYYELLDWRGYLLLACINAIFFLLTDCKTSTAMIFFSIFMFLIIRYRRGGIVSRWIAKLSIFTYIFGIVISIFFASASSVLYRWDWEGYLGNINEPKSLIFLNQILTGRIRFLTQTENWDGAVESWKWFPTENHDKFFDLGIVRMFYWYGILSAIVFLFLFLILFIYLGKKHKSAELLLLMIISLFTVVEAHFVSVYIGRCYPLFIMGMYIPEILNEIRGKATRKSENES